MELENIDRELASRLVELAEQIAYAGVNKDSKSVDKLKVRANTNQTGKDQKRVAMGTKGTIKDLGQIPI